MSMSTNESRENLSSGDGVQANCDEKQSKREQEQTGEEAANNDDRRIKKEPEKRGKKVMTNSN